MKLNKEARIAKEKIEKLMQWMKKHPNATKRQYRKAIKEIDTEGG